MSGFGEYDSSGGNATKMPTAVYHTIIREADVKRDGSGQPVRDTRSDKVRFRLVVEVDRGKFTAEKITRTMSISYAASQDGNFGPFPHFIEAATGIPMGDARQKGVGKKDLVGRPLSVMVKHERGYNNIVDFVSEDDADGGPGTPEPPTRAAAPARDTLDQDLGHRGPRATARPGMGELIGPGRERQVEALCRALSVDSSGLAEATIEATGGRTNDVALVYAPEFERLLVEIKNRRAVA